MAINSGHLFYSHKTSCDYKKRCHPFKARIYGLFWRFGPENFKVKTVDVICPIFKARGIRTITTESLSSTF